MDRERMAEARNAAAAVQQGKTRRVKYAFSEPRYPGKENQHSIIPACRQPHRCNAKQGNTADEHAQGTKAVDYESGKRLADAGDDEEHAHQQAEFRITHGESVFQPWEQRCEREMEKMRGA